MFFFDPLIFYINFELAVILIKGSFNISIENLGLGQCSSYFFADFFQDIGIGHEWLLLVVRFGFVEHVQESAVP